MARQNVYMSQKIYDAVRVIVDERRADGASHADANMSSVCSEMLDIGVRVTMNLKKKENEVDENGMSWEEMYKKKILEDSTKTRLCIQTIFQMLFDLQEIKSDTRYDFRQEISRMKHETDVMLDNFFGNNEG
ncbi:relaxosome protein TraM [Providencia heimbachae]|uniref:relaxosome protein TraM n=1 Tax=Providencia heimbachae TaxID=333962 RepID=UPI00223F16FF|nr:relaxosome protein TraM [Providencia heimbachae]